MIIEKNKIDETENFLNDLTELVAKYDLQISGEILLNKREELYKETVLKIVEPKTDMIKGKLVKNWKNTKIAIQPVFKKEQPVFHETQKTCIGFLDNMSLNYSKHLPSDFKALQNKIQKDHKGEPRY